MPLNCKGESEWQQTLDIAPKKRRLATKTAAESQHPFDHSAPRNFEIICCPEDVECDAHERGSIICGKCRVPVCRTCRKRLDVQHIVLGIPMALANDNFYGYAPEFIYKRRVRFIEAAAACPCWTTILIFYVEGDEGHLMREQMYGRERKRVQHDHAMGGHHQELTGNG